MGKIYITNNIVESINSKINFYLPKKVTSNIDFVKSLTNLIVKSKFNNNEGKRKDFITRSIIVIINKFNLNTNPKWINCEEFKNVLTVIIKQNETYDNSNDLELLINDLMDLDINNPNDINNIIKENSLAYNNDMIKIINNKLDNNLSFYNNIIIEDNSHNISMIDE